MKNWFLPFTTPSSSPSIESSLQPAAVENRTKVKKRKRTKKFRDKSRRGWVWVRQKSSNLEMEWEEWNQKFSNFAWAQKRSLTTTTMKMKLRPEMKSLRKIFPFFIVQQSSQPQLYVSKSFLIVQVAHRAQSQSMSLYELLPPNKYCS